MYSYSFLALKSTCRGGRVVGAWAGRQAGAPEGPGRARRRCRRRCRWAPCAAPAASCPCPAPPAPASARAAEAPPIPFARAASRGLPSSWARCRGAARPSSGTRPRPTPSAAQRAVASRERRRVSRAGGAARLVAAVQCSGAPRATSPGPACRARARAAPPRRCSVGAAAAAPPPTGPRPLARTSSTLPSRRSRVELIHPSSSERPAMADRAADRRGRVARRAGVPGRDRAEFWDAFPPAPGRGAVGAGMGVLENWGTGWRCLGMERPRQMAQAQLRVGAAAGAG
jgi:hypothetical protein